ncbi:MAG: arsenate reductase (glutaredoxin) [Gammaproteobacteria bacterium]|nr:MAG: arsenate reductase (glutaredoxin) [Gammaproteobacteria bacterium]
MDTITLYHNPRCSKSRQALALLQERGVEPDIVRYLENPPDVNTLRQLVKALNRPVRDILRTKEAPYKELDLARPELDDDSLLEAIAAHPKLLERPIAVKGDRAVIGRPPENVLELL